MKKYNNYTNAELNIEMKKLEDKYEKAKLQVLSIINDMKEMDNEYNSIKEEISKRKTVSF